jgi:2'-5' RNA ligase
MKAALAVLADYRIQNIARRMVFDMSRNFEMEFFGSLLPSHVSLKQPFTFESMDRLEARFDSLAARTAPFEIELDEIYYAEWNQVGFLGFNVVETPTLRALHNQINRELPEVVEDPSARHDGEEYRFHLTAELGPVSNVNPYKTYFEGLATKEAALSFRAEQLALFYYADRPITSGSFILYRVMPFGGS